MCCHDACGVVRAVWSTQSNVRSTASETALWDVEEKRGRKCDAERQRQRRRCSTPNVDECWLPNLNAKNGVSGCKEHNTELQFRKGCELFIVYMSEVGMPVSLAGLYHYLEGLYCVTARPEKGEGTSGYAKKMLSVNLQHARATSNNVLASGELPHVALSPIAARSPDDHHSLLRNQ